MELLELPEFNKYCCDSMYKNANEIPILDAQNLSYEEFFINFIWNNQPCLIKNIGNDWNSFQCWIYNNTPDFGYLDSKFGEATVTIQDCNQRYYNSQMPSKWIFSEYLKYWESYIKSEYSSELPLYYLKDWHLKNDWPTDHFYKVPVYFASDWLNEYLVENALDDYRFVYMGPKGTWTPLHADVMTSYSWSTNICGQKRWVLFPPGEENHLLDDLQNLPYDITDIKLNNCKSYEIIQNPGEAIFVPSNWHHQVWNLKDTISINHNWINACNIVSVWKSIVKHSQDVKKEIDDCRDMDDFISNCQVMLQASFGINFKEFYKFISYIARKRIELLQSNIEMVMVDNRSLGFNHASFDLKMLENVLIICLQNEDIQELEIDVEMKSLLLNIQTVLQI